MRFFFLLRLHHWPKNLFLFLPAFFAGELTNLSVIMQLMQGFVCFSIAASAVYIFNDYRDIEIDKEHPIKMNRPLASGSISPKLALIIVFLLFLVSIPYGFYLNPYFGYCIIVYFLINVSYSLGLKNISILDTIMVASGFLIRTLAGGWLTDITISHWLVIMVFLLAFFLAIAKRRDDLILFSQGKAPLRTSSKKYTVEFINTILSMLAGVIIVSYILYTISDDVVSRFHSKYVYFTAFFVFAGLIRFLQITIVENRSGSPTRIFLTDIFIQVTVLIWVSCFVLFIYLAP